MTGLAGKRVLVTRPRAQAAELIDLLASLGAEAVVFPTIEITPPADPSQLDRAISNLSAYRWVIFTSANGVTAFWQRLSALGLGAGWPAGVSVAAIGPATAQALQESGVTPDFVPTEYIAEAILPGLGEVRGQRILLPRADKARKALAVELAARGALPDEIAAYYTVPAHHDPQELDALERDGVDVATFTSSSTVESFFELLGPRAPGLLKGAVIACIGPITAATARARGLAVSVIAEEYTAAGLVKTLQLYFDS